MKVNQSETVDFRVPNKQTTSTKQMRLFKQIAWEQSICVLHYFDATLLILMKYSVSTRTKKEPEWGFMPASLTNLDWIRQNLASIALKAFEAWLASFCLLIYCDVKVCTAWDSEIDRLMSFDASLDRRWIPSKHAVQTPFDRSSIFDDSRPILLSQAVHGKKGMSEPLRTSDHWIFASRQREKRSV